VDLELVRKTALNVQQDTAIAKIKKVERRDEDK
jgi:hypothetical protein